MENNILDKKLSFEDQRYILKNLFCFECVKTDGFDNEHFVIYDEEGDEFYGYDSNDKHDLSTLRGIIKYAEYIAVDRAIYDHNYKIQTLLGIK